MLKDLCNITKHSNICIIGILEGEEGEKREGIVFEEIIAKTSFIWGEKDTQVHQLQIASNK